MGVKVVKIEGLG